MATDNYNLVVEEATRGIAVSPLPEQSTILAEVEHMQLSGHQNPASVPTSAFHFSSTLSVVPACVTPTKCLEYTSNSA